MKLNIKIISLLLTCNFGIKANDALYDNEEYSQDKVSNLMMEPTVHPSIPTITRSENEPKETETTMTYTYYSRNNRIGFDYITTSLPSDVDNVYISCVSTNNARTDSTDLNCDRHMTCYKKYDTFFTENKGNKDSYLYCDILIHEKNDPIPQTRPTTYINPCIPKIVTTTSYEEFLLYSSVYDNFPMTSGTVGYNIMNQYVYSIKPTVVSSLTCSSKNYGTSIFTYPTETLIPFEVPVFDENGSLAEIGNESRNLILLKKDIKKGSKLDGYCQHFYNYNYTPLPTPQKLTKLPMSGIRTPSSPISKVPPNTNTLSTTTRTSSFITKRPPNTPLTAARTSPIPTKNTTPSSKTLLSTVKAPISITTATPKKPISVITSVKTIPILSSNNKKNIALEKRSKSVFQNAIPHYSHYCRSNGECFGIHTVYNRFRDIHQSYSVDCFVYTQEPQPTTSVPITDICKLKLLTTTSYYSNRKYSSRTIINGGIMTLENIILDRSLYSRTGTTYECVTSSEEPVITTTEAIVTPIIETMPTDMVESTVMETIPTDIVESTVMETIPTDIVESTVKETIPTDMVESSVIETVPIITATDLIITTKCVPEVVTVTEKSKITFIQRETVTVTVTESS